MVSLARTFVILGVVLLVAGGLIYLLARTGLPLGRLPGDFRIQTANFSCFFPLATMILLSVVLTILLNVLLRLVGRK
jgi:hypothetical protein